MWSFDRRNLILGALALGGLASCGFTPAYGPNGTATRLQNRILVSEPSDRNSYLLTRHLETRLGRSASPEFGLNVTLELQEEGIAVTSTNITARYNVIGKAAYELLDLRDGSVLTKGQVNSFTGYSATGSTASIQTAEADAYERLMVILGDQIVTRLIAASGNLPE